MQRTDFKTQHHHNNELKLLVLVVVSVVVILAGLGLREPWPADEPRFAQIAQEMVQSGQWFFPRRGGELYPDKPPVFMWAIASLYYLTDSIRFSFLLPSAICSLITLFAVYDIGKRIWTPNIARRGAWLLLATLQFVLQAKSAQIDAMLCCWITLGCYGLLRHLLLGPDWRWYYLACFFMGLGVITKAVGFLPFLILLPYLLARKYRPQADEIKADWRWILGPLILVLTAGLWLFPMLYQVELATDPAFSAYRDNILFRQTVRRYTDSWGHIKPFWYYLISVIPLFWLPLSLMLPALIRPWKSALQAGDRRILLPLGWVLLVLIFFSLSPGKRGVYILPALPMLVLAIAPYLNSLVRKKWFNRAMAGGMTLIAVLLFIVAIAGLSGVRQAVAQSEKYGIEPWYFILSLAIVLVLAQALFRFRHGYLSWLTGIVIIWLIYSLVGYPLLNKARTPERVFANMQQYMDADAELGLINFREQFLLFSPYPTSHFGFNVPQKQQERAAWQWLGKGNKRFLLVADSLSLSCFDNSTEIKLGFAHRKHWLLLTADNRLENCESPAAWVREYRYRPQ